MCDVEPGIALVGVSEEPILMGVHDATMVSLYKTRYLVWFYILFILLIHIIIEYMTDLLMPMDLPSPLLMRDARFQEVKNRGHMTFVLPEIHLQYQSCADIHAPIP